MTRGPTGDYLTTTTVGSERVKAFLPHPLPPIPPVEIAPTLRDKLDATLLALGRLDSVTTLLPDTRLFLYSYVRKEALLSSQIEGTQSSLSDLLMYEADGEPGVLMSDVVEVSNYVAALDHGLKRLGDGFPISNRLIREIHGILLSRGRGAGKQPGEFRRSQNWIGGSRPGNATFVPPPPEYVPDCMGLLERWLHDQPERTPTLLKAALAHVQFETIHPFLDGNGRVGRLLIPLLFCVEGVLSDPLLYLSLYLKEHRDEYYEHLARVRKYGEWESWLDFFTTGVRETAEGAVNTTRRLVSLFQADRERIRAIGRGASSALLVHRALEHRPLTSIPRLVKETGLSTPAVAASISNLEHLDIVREVTGRKRDRLFSYVAYVRVLAEGTEPIRSHVDATPHLTAWTDLPDPPPPPGSATPK